jgi:hypothetical protein
MKIKVTEATQEERDNLFNFLVKRYKDECEISPFGFEIEVDEVDKCLDLVIRTKSLQKFEIEVDGVIKIIFNQISFIEEIIPESKFEIERGVAVPKQTEKSIKAVTYVSYFYELIDDKFIDISNNDFLNFGYK